MARQIKNYLRGTIGPLSFRVVNGVQHISQKTAQGEVRQTLPTKRAANTFGMASRLGAEMRKSFKGSIGEFPESTMVSRMNSRLIQALNEVRDPGTLGFAFTESSFKQLNGFDFTIQSPFARSMRNETALQWQDGTLHVSCGTAEEPLKLNFPSRSSSCEVIISVALFRLDEGLRCISPLKQVVTVKRNETFLQPLAVNFELPAGCFFVAAMFLKFYRSTGNKELLLNSKTFNPGTILLAQHTPGNYIPGDNLQWTLMYPLAFNYTDPPAGS